MIILGLETSCDDTSAALFKDGKVLSSIVSTQMMHTETGGVIPEVAARAHQRNILSVIDSALKEAGVTLREVDAVSTTFGPGLIGPLLVGVNTAKGICFTNKLPLIPVNHIEAHIFANFIEHPEFEPPLVVLVVSGGHTELIYMKDYNHYELIGKTRDDAAGECLDKVSKMLGLGFPGGKVLDDLAKKGDSKFHRFPKALPTSFDFSFSGLKTSVKIYLESQTKEFIEENKADIVASFLEAVAVTLTDKLIRAAKQYGVTKIALAGGVSANSRLRDLLSQKAQRNRMQFFYPAPRYCTDNAAMVAMAGFKKYNAATDKSIFYNYAIDAVPNLRLI